MDLEDLLYYDPSWRFLACKNAALFRRQIFTVMFAATTIQCEPIHRLRSNPSCSPLIIYPSYKMQTKFANRSSHCEEPRLSPFLHVFDDGTVNSVRKIQIIISAAVAQISRIIAGRYMGKHSVD